VLEQRVLRKTVGLKTGNNRRVEEYNVMRRCMICTPHHIIRVIKSRTKRLAENVVRMVEKRNGGETCRKETTWEI
jgi:hypothetical protein